jgi:hypothetical protein
MRLFFAGAEKGQFQNILYSEGVRNILMSFYWHKDDSSLKQEKEKGFNIFLDSGGYSARKQGINVDIKEYGKFLEENKDYIFTAANLDVMDTNKAQENQKYLEQFYQVLPVYHFSEYAEKNEDLLKQFCEKYKYIAIGGIAGMNPDRKLLSNYLNFSFRTIMKYKGLKVHGFGITALQYLKNYPFYSVDSTSWLIGGKFGTILKWELNSFKNAKNIHYSDKKKMIDNRIPISLTEGYEGRLRHNIREILKMEKEITELWKVRGIEWVD